MRMSLFQVSFTTASMLVVTAGYAHADNWIDDGRTAASDFVKDIKNDPDWKVRVGGGLSFTPTYIGSNRSEVNPVPVVDAQYKDGLFFANMTGVGSYFLQGDDYKVGAAVGYQNGRDQDDDIHNLRGMGDVDGSLTANLLGKYQYGPVFFTGKVASAMTGDYGTTADVYVGSGYPLMDKLFLVGSVGTTWGDDEHMKNLFGVSSGQAVRSGYSRYDASAGLQDLSAILGLNYTVNTHWNVNTTLKASQLVGDAKDSPIVKDSFAPSMFVTAGYKF